MMPVRCAIASPRDGSRAASILRSSSQTRSRDTFASDGSAGAMPRSVSGSSSNSSCAANRTARITRRPSSVNRRPHRVDVAGRRPRAAAARAMSRLPAERIDQLVASPGRRPSR